MCCCRSFFETDINGVVKFVDFFLNQNEYHNGNAVSILIFVLPCIKHRKRLSNTEGERKDRFVKAYHTYDYHSVESNCFFWLSHKFFSFINYYKHHSLKKPKWPTHIMSVLSRTGTQKSIMSLRKYPRIQSIPTGLARRDHIFSRERKWKIHSERLSDSWTTAARYPRLGRPIFLV